MRMEEGDDARLKGVTSRFRGAQGCARATEEESAVVTMDVAGLQSQTASVLVMVEAKAATWKDVSRRH